MGRTCFKISENRTKVFLIDKQEDSVLLEGKLTNRFVGSNPTERESACGGTGRRNCVENSHLK